MAGDILAVDHSIAGGFLNRRSFLDTLAAVGMLGPLHDRGPRMGKPLLSKIGIQLYTVRREMDRDFEGTLGRLAAMGYREVEFAGYFDREPEEIKAMLHRYDLAAPSAHVPIELVHQDWPGVLDAAGIIGHRYVVVPWLPPESRGTLDDFRRLADEFNRLGEESKRSGVRFAYHNHDFEFSPLEGQLPYDVLLAGTDPANVAFELDLMWISKGGQDPLAYFARYPGRFEMVHVKDSSGPPEYRQVDVGRGTIDFRRILTRGQQVGIRHAFVEHDDPPDPLAFARASYDYLKALKPAKSR
jgi:sugar phosphate isomerase/epimerase